MKKFLLLSLSLMLLSLPAGAAGKNAKTFSGKYQNKAVREVLSDLRKETGTSVKLQKKLVNPTRKVTVTFRNADPDDVIHELFDCEYEISRTGKKQTGYFVAKRDLSPREQVIGTYPSDSSLVRSDVTERVEVESQHVTLITRRQMWDRVLTDSVLTEQDRITRPSHEVQPEAPAPSRKGHSLQAYVAGGYSSLGYQLQGGSNLGGVGAEVALRYAYFFTPEWGLSVGVDYDTYGSAGRLKGTCRWDDQIDSEGEQYNHLAVPHGWTERQRIHEVSVPVMAEYQHMFSDKVGIFAALGGYVGLPLVSSWGLASGKLEHQGEYPKWNLLLYGIGEHDFYTEAIGRDFSKKKHNLDLGMLTAGLKADVGAILPLTDKIDLFAGVYAKADVLDIAPSGEKAALGWQQPGEAGYRQHAFMPEYAGVVNTDRVGAVRPYEVGVKVGIHFRPAKRAPKPVVEHDCLVVTDSLYSARLHHDTVYHYTRDSIQSLRQTLQKAVIWFAVNDYEHPRLKPADILDRVAEILIANPSEKVAINGHASAEGNARANQVLSDRRARCVADLLIRKGVQPSQLRVNGFSSSVDYQGDNTEGSKAELNRRVEIIPLND